MKLEAVSSKSEIVKIIKYPDVFVMSLTGQKLVQGAHHDYYGKGSPFQCEVLAKNLICLY